MAAGFTMLLAKIAAIASWFGKLFVGVFKSLWHVVTDMWCWAFDGVLSVAVSAVNAVDLAALDAYAGTWSGLPAELIPVLSALRVGEAGAIIAAAIGIRIVLQLIPFTRLGS
ncbi:DUF2523 family protein [Xylophilus ampelinus]|nr:DUF2523 family protein [Xylophilus ampelinus]MCS4511881.1 DUF2523 domain-containing protein [Xylophilus ampelinus]